MIPWISAHISRGGWPKNWTYISFYNATDKATGAESLFANGDSYGIAVLGRVAAGNWQGVRSFGTDYTAQDDNETANCLWNCLGPAGEIACVTHLSSRSNIAIAQFNELMSIGLLNVQDVAGMSSKMVIGRDLNLDDQVDSGMRGE